MRRLLATLAIAAIGALATGGIAAAAPSHVGADHTTGAAIVQDALRYLGTRYTPTGDSPETGFSDVGFVQYVYGLEGISLPADLPDLLASGPRVSKATLRPGDLVFFKNTVWTGISHVGIYLGHGKFIHAEWYGIGVTVTSIKGDARDGNYWTTHYKTARNPVPATGI